ncbi:MAG: alpha/beta hydrolase [Synechococcales cyanobacterium M58_A2018_015]|nr:alpha/beta hydrolase [Synechococcales cyanobacterium M58_A2018_015]
MLVNASSPSRTRRPRPSYRQPSAVLPQQKGSEFSAGHSRWIARLRGVCCGLALALGWGSTLPATAADQVAIRLGPLKQTVAVRDLEYFAQTGRIPPRLRLYAPLLTSEVQEALRSELRLDPSVGEKLVEDLLHSSAGERFLNTLQAAIPDTDAAQLQTALLQAAKQSDGVTILDLLRSFPSQTVTIDAMSAIALASQMNLPYWQSQALSSLLERELTVKGEPLRTSFDPTKTGPHWVWKQTMVLRDYQRDRSIPVDLYWSRRTQGPLVVISHGFGADRRFLGYLAYHLSSYGLTVVALEHPASNVAWLTGDSMAASSAERSTILPATEFVDRPKDISFVLDRLSRLNQFSSTLGGKFNTQQVTVIGHSLGGYTALALAGADLSLDHLRQFCNDPNPVMLSPADLIQCNAADLPEPPEPLRDPRVAQTILLNPVMGRLFDANSLAQVKIPVLVLAGTDDAITPAVSQQFLPFTQLQTTKYLLTAIGGTHLSVGDPANLNQVLAQSVFVRERGEQETEELRQLLQAVSLAFIKQLTPESRRYTPFLTPAYAQSFSTPSLKLRLNSELPPNFSNWLKMAALPMEQLIATTLSKRAQSQGFCGTNLPCLVSGVPLVMFILPGGLPLAARHFFQLKRQAERKRRRR